MSIQIPLPRTLHRLAPLAARVRPRFGLPTDFRETASRSWTLGPSTKARCPGAIFDPADLAKIVGTPSEGTVAGELERVMVDREVTHGATMAYEFRDASMVAGHLFTSRTAHWLGTGKAPLLAPRHLPDVADGTLASTPYGARYFGHWLLDDLPLTLAAQAISEPFSVLAQPSRSQRAYFDIVGLHPRVVTDGFFRRLVVIHDSADNDFKRARYLAMRERAKAGRPAAPASATPGVMILRGESGVRRRLVNEAVLADRFRQQGWTILDPGVHTPAQMIDACEQSPVVLGVEGSQLCNGLMWMPLNGCLVVIQPPQRFCTVLKNACDCLGLRYAFVIADAVDETDFQVDTGALDALLERVAARS